MTDIRNLSRPVEGLRNAGEAIAPAAAPVAATLSSPQLQSLQTLATQLGQNPQTGDITLFTGPDTAAKAAAAQTLANNLHRELRHIDLGSVVDQSSGDPGDALAKLLASTPSGAILFLDEADALFGKRTGVQDSHDRYASVEMSSLLQHLRQYTGIVILAVSTTDGWDPALLARAHTSLRFPPA